MEGDRTARVLFTPSGRRGDFPHGTRLLDAARSLGVDIDGLCGGRGCCGRCQVDVGTQSTRSTHADADAPVSEKSLTEQRWEQRRGALAPGRRFSCTTQLQGDLVVDVPAFSQLHPAQIRKSVQLADGPPDSAVQLFSVELGPSNPSNPLAHSQRLALALSDAHGLDSLSMSLTALQQMASAITVSGGRVLALVRERSHVIGLWPDVPHPPCGVAVDVGSTTLAAHLCDLESGRMLASAGRMNPQIRYGEDLMSRLSYIQLNPGGELTLTEAVRQALNELIDELTQAAGVPIEAVVDLVLVGNPIMHHLVFGINPLSLGLAPFALVRDEAITVQASDALGLQVHPEAQLYGLPCIAGHVGADTAAAILAEAPHQDAGLTLLVDIGTNAEIVLANNERLVATSCPTGPAFEGAQISCGQRATVGAIERVRINPETGTPRFKLIGSDVWSDHPDFNANMPPQGVTGLCGSGVLETIGELFLAGILHSDGTFNDAWLGHTPNLVRDNRTLAYQLHQDHRKTLYLTQNDVRAIQLAKAALYASIRLLMAEIEADTVDRIKLAGAFGSHIDGRYALVLGLVPDCDPSTIEAVGNAAGRGACLALLNHGKRREVEALARRIEKIETATEAEFQTHFVNAMAFPHKTDQFKHLAAAVPLPEPRKTAPTSRRRRNRL